MFVVGVVQRVHESPTDTSTVTIQWPVIFENESEGYAGDRIVFCQSRDAAQALADALNETLKAHTT